MNRFVTFLALAVLAAVLCVSPLASAAVSSSGLFNDCPWWICGNDKGFETAGSGHIAGVSQWCGFVTLQQ